MASAPPGHQDEEKMHNDEKIKILKEKMGEIVKTPPRRPHVEGEADHGPTGQPAGGGGAIGVNLINALANHMREEMSALKTDLEAKFNTLNRDLEVKMSGRKGTGHYEHGSSEDINEKMEELSNKIEKERTDAADTRTNLAEEFIKLRDDIKDIKEIINDDEKITIMIEKYKDIVINDTMNERLTSSTTKLKDALDKGLLEANKAIENIKQNNKEDMDAYAIGITDKIADIKKHINDRDDMPTLTPLSNMVEDKLLGDLIDKKIKENFNNTLAYICRMNAIYQENVTTIIKNFEKKTREKKTRENK